MINYILEQLIAEKQLLSDPACWTKGEFARDKNGVAVNEYSPDAVCWCQHGVIYKVVNDIRFSQVVNWSQMRILKDNIASTLGFHHAVAFNDYPATTHADLMDFYDKCIERASDSS